MIRALMEYNQRNRNPKIGPKIHAGNKSTVTKMENVFDGLISRLDTVEERISELDDTSIESSKTEKQREQKLKKTDRLFIRIVGQ